MNAFNADMSKNRRTHIECSNASVIINVTFANQCCGSSSHLTPHDSSDAAHTHITAQYKTQAHLYLFTDGSSPCRRESYCWLWPWRWGSTWWQQQNRFTLSAESSGKMLFTCRLLCACIWKIVSAAVGMRGRYTILTKVLGHPLLMKDLTTYFPWVQILMFKHIMIF